MMHTFGFKMEAGEMQKLAVSWHDAEDKTPLIRWPRKIINPLGKAPALKLEDGSILTESNAILSR